MPALSDTLLRRGPVGIILERAREIEILDRSYQIAAQTFVALVPLVLVVTEVVTGGQQYLASALIDRFGLVGYAAQSVRALLQSETGTIYWTGVALSLYSAFSLSRRISRAYTTIWALPPIPVRAQWRGLVWIGVQALMMALASGMRGYLWGSGPLLTTVAAIGLFGVWMGTEYASQWLLTMAQVARGRLLVASALVALGKVGTSLWALAYLSRSMTRQAELYGPLGVVFSVFTYLLVVSVVSLAATLIAAVLTQPAGTVQAEGDLDPQPR